MNRFLSQKFRFYSFISISLLLFVHGYNLNDTYLIPYSMVKEPLTFTTFIEYFLANGALRFRIPLLFLISGYIYALQDHKPYMERIKRRFYTLVIPFIVWSAVGLLITYIWQRFPLTAQAVADAQVDQLGDNRKYEEIGWIGVLYRWLVQPVAFHLWFIRSLFFYNAIYPIIRWALVKMPIVWFIILFLFWQSITFFLFFEGQGLFFFSLGIFICKSNYPIHKAPKWFSHYLSWLFFLGIGVIKTFMAFELDPDNPINKVVMFALFDISVFSGILAIWFGADPLVKYLMGKKWFVWASAFSFTIYALHVPLINYISRLMFILLHNFKYYRLATYLTAPVIVFAVCLLFGAAFRKLFPKSYRIATGGRGF